MTSGAGAHARTLTPGEASKGPMSRALVGPEVTAPA